MFSGTSDGALRDSLFATLRTMVTRGLSVVVISHKMHEILSVSDRVAVLRRGRKVGEVATADTDRHALAEMMVGRAVSRPVVEHMTPGEPVLELSGVSVRSRGVARLLDDVSLTVRAHEIVGVAGVAGNGQSVLAAVLSGMQRPDSGVLRFRGEPVTRFHPRECLADVRLR